MDISRITAILIITTLFAGLAAASPAELTIFPEESSTEINSFTSYEVEVENVGTVDDVYEIQHNRPGEISVAPQKVELQAGQSKTVNVWYNPRQSRDEGRYSFQISAKSRADGQTYSTTGYVNVIHNYKIDLITSPSENTVCRGENAQYEVQVTNDGIQDDEIALSTEFGELSRERVNLSPGETTTVTLTASSEQEDERSFNVRASSTSVSYAAEQQTLNFNAETCFNSEVSVNPETQDTAAFTPAEFDVTVRNLGTRSDEFTVSTDRGTLSQETLAVGPQSTESTQLSYTPTELGSQEINIEARGQSEASRTAEIEAYNGMESTVSFDESRTVCRDESATYTATIENTGEAEETFELSSNVGQLLDEDVELQPGDSIDTQLEVNSTGMEDGEHTVRLESEASTFNEPVNSDETAFTVENCWDVEMNIVPEVASAGENMSTIYEIRLNNPGTRENTYQLTHEGPEWVEIRPESITIAAGESGTAYMYAGAPFEKKGEVEITAIAEGNQVRETQTVNLVIGQDIEEAIRSREGGAITGRFMDSASNLYNSITEADNVQRGIAAILIGLLLTAAILYREW